MWSGLGPGLANYVTCHPPVTFASAAKKATQNKLPHATNLVGPGFSFWKEKSK